MDTFYNDYTVWIILRKFSLDSQGLLVLKRWIYRNFKITKFSYFEYFYDGLFVPHRREKVGPKISKIFVNSYNWYKIKFIFITVLTKSLKSMLEIIRGPKNIILKFIYSHDKFECRVGWNVCLNVQSGPIMSAIS